MIVVVGRSNVGKSSTIRALTGRKVRVGKKPGSTRWEQMIDLGPFVMADMAGFGYMSGQSKEYIEEMKTSIIHKLESWSDRIVLSILILDLSLFRTIYERWNDRGEIPIDVEFYSFLSEISPRVVIVANKIDKIKKKHLSRELEYMESKMRDVVPDGKPIIVTTCASKKQGIELLRETIENALEETGLGRPEW